MTTQTKQRVNVADVAASVGSVFGSIAARRKVFLGAGERNPTRKSFEGTGGTAHTVRKVLLQKTCIPSADGPKRVSGGA